MYGNYIRASKKVSKHHPGLIKAGLLQFKRQVNT